MSEAKKRIKKFWQYMRAKNIVFDGRQLEKEVVNFYNANLDVFPPGYSPKSMIEDAFKDQLLIQRKNYKFIVL